MLCNCFSLNSHFTAAFLVVFISVSLLLFILSFLFVKGSKHIGFTFYSVAIKLKIFKISCGLMILVDNSN